MHMYTDVHAWDQLYVYTHVFNHVDLIFVNGPIVIIV
jgi:hypothetical protein